MLPLAIFDAHPFEWQDYVFFLSNLAIITGYLAAAIVIAFLHKILPIADSVLNNRTRFFGVNFFLTCMMTHSEMALHIVTQEPLLNASTDDPVSWHMIIIHSWQAVAITLFLIFLARDILRFLELLAQPKES